MLRADAAELYELLKPKLGEEEPRALLHFVEERTIQVVRNEIAKGLATREDIGRLERNILTFEWRTRLYFVAIGALIIIVGKLLGVAP